MNITYHDRTKLILEARLPPKVRVTMFCLSSVMSLAMVLLASNIVADVGTKRLSCSRTEASRIQPFRLLKAKSSLPKLSKSLATCVVRESKYFGLVQSPPRSFEQVQEAQAQSSRNPDGGSITINDETIPILDHRLLFTISNGSAVTVFDSDRVYGSNGYQSLADGFNEFIQSDRPTLRIQEDRRFTSQTLTLLMLPLIFLFMSLLFLYGSLLFKTVTFDRTLMQMKREFRWLFVKRSKSHSITGVKDVTISDEDPDNYILSLSPKSNYPFFRMLSSSKSELEVVANAIRSVLNLPKP